MENLRDIRRVFFDNADFYAVIGSKEFNNKEIQQELLEAQNQANQLQYNITNNRVTIWNPENKK